MSNILNATGNIVNKFNIDPSTLPFPIGVDALCNYENYGMYKELITNGCMEIDVKILDKSNIDYHFECILNILKDGIEQDRVHKMYLMVTFEDGIRIKLSIFDYWANLIMWKLPILIGDKIYSKLLFFHIDLTKGAIKSYIDEFLDRHRTDLDNITLNNIIDDTIYKFGYVDLFSYYLLNTVNEEDTIKLMKEDKDVYNCIHLDLSNTSLNNIKDEGMKYANILANKIRNSAYHCLRDSLRSKEGISVKQFKEFAVHIGTKPDGRGGIFPGQINTNFSTDGIKSSNEFFLDGSTARYAQILQKSNVGDSGSFSRILGNNNMNTKIHPDSKYVCNTKNFVRVFIKDVNNLNRFKNRWYKLKDNGPERKISYSPARDNTDLIGRYIYLRSPMTCTSNARGEGICYRCYGDLAYVNNDINIGKIAAELVGSQLTQRLLSAKHLLETKVVDILWSNNQFDQIFEMDQNMIKIQDGFNLKKWKLLINYDDLDKVDELDEQAYNDYLTQFYVQDPKGNIMEFNTTSYDKLYLSKELLDIINRRKLIDNQYIVDFTSIGTSSLFIINIENNELSKTLDLLENILNKQSDIKMFKTKDEWFQAFIDTVSDGDLYIDAIHCEVIMSNQLRRPSNEYKDNVLLNPEWEYPDEPYQILTLDKALKTNPSITISLLYKKPLKTTIDPLSFKKNAPSNMDICFMEKPQNFMNNNKDLRENTINKDEKTGLIVPVYYVN